MIARFSLSEGGMKFIPLIFQYSIRIYIAAIGFWSWLSLKTWAQFENLGELVKNTIFVA